MINEIYGCNKDTKECCICYCEELMLQFCRVNICVCVINVVKLSKKDMITKNVLFVEKNFEERKRR